MARSTDLRKTSSAWWWRSWGSLGLNTRETSMAQRPLGLDPNDPAVRSAVLGVEVTEWVQGAIGSYIMDRVRRRLSVLEQTLKTIDPTAAMDIAKAQAEVMHLEGFAGWLGDAIQAGITAQEIIKYEVGETDGAEDRG
jgi:hypothetical protein